jgi:hypothetical protein
VASETESVCPTCSLWYISSDAEQPHGLAQKYGCNMYGCLCCIVDGTIPDDAREFVIPLNGLEIGCEKSTRHMGSFLKVLCISYHSLWPSYHSVLQSVLLNEFVDEMG